MGMKFERAYFYYLDAEGQLYHAQTLLTDPQFLDFFFKRLRLNTTGHYEKEYPYVSFCGREANFLKPEDTPLVFYAYRDGRLFYAPSLSVPFAPEKLRFSSAGILYHPAPVGSWGRIGARLLQQWIERLEGWGPWYRFRWQNREYVVQPLDEDPRYAYIAPRPESVCVGCGPQNPSNLGLHFLWDRQQHKVRSWVIPTVLMQGHPQWVHGGFIALLHDEIMGKFLTYRIGPAATRTLRVGFNHPMLVGCCYEVSAELLKSIGKRYYLQSRIVLQDQPDKVISVAEGEFVVVSERSKGKRP